MKRDGLVVKNKGIRQVNGRLENKNVSFGWQEAIACFARYELILPSMSFNLNIKGVILEWSDTGREKWSHLKMRVQCTSLPQGLKFKCRLNIKWRARQFSQSEWK